VDAVTSLGAMPVDVAGWGVDVCYSCTQKGLGAPSGLAPIVFSPRALERRQPSRSFYLDLALLEGYWVQRRYHHTISAPLVYALREALVLVEEEGLDARFARHRRRTRCSPRRCPPSGSSCCRRPLNGCGRSTPCACQTDRTKPPCAARCSTHGIEIGAGLGPLAGQIWRIGLMGSGSTAANVSRLIDALRAELRP
jgi:alanine-glyoxylate transaminase / serine-glyoxylate transaminase / serine-pyruvate transaminase